MIILFQLSNYLVLDLCPSIQIGLHHRDGLVEILAQVVFFQYVHGLVHVLDYGLFHGLVRDLAHVLHYDLAHGLDHVQVHGVVRAVIDVLFRFDHFSQLYHSVLGSFPIESHLVRADHFETSLQRVGQLATLVF